MIEAPLPSNEAERLAALLSYDVLDTGSELAYDDLTRIASSICGAPIALISLVDADRQWFKSKVGLEARQTERRVAFCSHSILQPQEVMVVKDSLVDERFHDNPLAVEAPHVRFYAGAPLVTPEGYPLGTLCVIDHQPRELDPEQIETLRALSRQVVSQLELRKNLVSVGELAHEVQRTNEELRQFTSIASHDLREPLRKLVAFSDLLRKDAGEGLPQRANEDLDFIVDASRRMDRLVGSLLELSRAGSADIVAEELALEDCVHLALDSLELFLEERGAQVEVDALPSLSGDRTLLTQVFQNLIGNAVKFSGERPHVHITCSEEDGAVVVGVQDRGIGLEAKYAEQIFAPFKRLHGRDAYEGAGIGLSIVRKVIERHGGTIWVESTPGEGSHFRFTLDGILAAPTSARAA